MTDNQRTLYDVLNISAHASDDEIKVAAQQLMKLYQSQARHDSTAQQTLAEIEHAYKILSSPYRRNAYDIGLEEQQQSQVSNNSNLNWKEITEISKKKIEKLGSWFDTQSMGDKLNHFVTKLKPTKASISINSQIIQPPIVAQNTDNNQFLTVEKETVEPILNIETPQERTTSTANHLPHLKFMLDEEQTLERLKTHWFFLFDIWGITLIALATYLWNLNPFDLLSVSPKIELKWLADLLNKDSVTVWEVGLLFIAAMGVLLWLETFIARFSSRAILTTQRLIHHSGFLLQRTTEIRLNSVDSIVLEQSLLGKLMQFGTLTVTGVAGTKIRLSTIYAPKHLRQIIWEITLHK